MTHNKSAWQKGLIILLTACFNLAISGCAIQPPVTGSSHKDALPPLKISDEDISRSKKLGLEFLSEIRKQVRFVKDPEINGAVSGIGRSILAANGEDPASFHFMVIRDNTINAFAVPGGYIFIYDGLLGKMTGPDELAGVLSHEIGHVKKDHFFKEDAQANIFSIAGIVAALLTREPAALVAGQLASESSHLSFSREHEREADSVGLRMLNRAGYNPLGLKKFFNTLREYEKFNPSLVPAYFSTHPVSEEREMNMEVLSRALPPPGPKSEIFIDWDRMRLLVELESEPDRPIEEFLNEISGKSVSEERNHYLKGLVYFKTNHLQEAMEEYGLAIRINPRASIYHSNIARTFFNLKKMDDAELSAKRALTLDRTNAEGEEILGEIDEQKKNYPQALEHYEKAVALRPENPVLHYLLGALYSKTGESREASWHLAKYYRLEFKTDQAMNELEKLRASSAAKDPAFRKRAEEEILDILREGF
ncbi:MAG TPA: M48 family metalloprotease [Nitrospiria bacterium]|nr:M48 family metalloprotease [Nitrospiria bacterium]